MKKSRKDKFRIRGLMLDPARLTERHEFYFDLLPQLADWGFNTIVWHFNDDEGFALKLETHPELASPYAFTKAQTRRFIRAAKEVGIDVIPEFETLGHSLAITALPQYSHLFDGDPFGHNAICPSHRETIPLLKEIILEVAELFESPYFHAGLDEADLGQCPRCRRRGRNHPSWWVFAEHVKRIHKIVTSCGKRMIMWADSVERHPELLRAFPKDIVMAHWHYREVPAERIVPSVEAGFEILCSPAPCGRILQPDAAAFRNVDETVTLARRLSPKGCLGVLACWWEPARNLRDTHPLSTAYTGQALHTGNRPDRLRFARDFARKHFGLRDVAVGRALWELHELTLTREELNYLMYDHPGHIHQALNLTGLEGFAKRTPKANQCVSILRAARKKVKVHKGEFDAYLLSGRIIATALNSASHLAEAYRAYELAGAYRDRKGPREMIMESLGRTADILAEMQGPIDEVTHDTSKEWDRTRHPRDEKKDGSSPRIRQRGARTLLPKLMRHRRYHAKLVRDFRRAVASYRRGGPFPGGL